ncbi:MAG: hypothetical protein WA430_02090 [Acidobacteriaceae bacterium]
MSLQADALQHGTQSRPWNLADRIAFRFCLIYLASFSLCTQIVTSLFPIPKIDIPDLDSFWPMSQIVLWTEVHILRIAQPIPWTETGSGDRMFDWAMVVSLLIISALATALWSILDRKRESYATPYKWFLLFVRFALAGQMIIYGADKIIPLQMPFPSLVTLLKPFHAFSPMAVLWSSIGAARAYEIFAGCAELLGGILLIVPRTATLGALICLADMTQVFLLNMSYDVPVKLLSFHLILMSLFLLFPERQRLVDFFFRARAVPPSRPPQLFLSRRKNRIALWAQIAFGVWLVGMNAWGFAAVWNTYGGGRPKSSLYGIWDVEQLSIDGQIRPPLLTDNNRWRRAIFDYPHQMTLQRMDDSFSNYSASIDTKTAAISLTKPDDSRWKGKLTYQRVGGDHLILDGAMDNHKVHMQLLRVDSNKFLLISRGFHWVQEFPFNR